MKGIRRVIPALWVILVLIQFVQPARNKGGQVMPADVSKTVTVPANVQGILKKACYDCHSNHTNYSWYAYIQPVHWFLNNHIQSGKAALNFSEFGSYTPRRQKNKLQAIENSLKDGSMPLSSYMLVHGNAVLTEAEKTLLISWVKNSRDHLNKRSY